jgi:hypothetical protein
VSPVPHVEIRAHKRKARLMANGVYPLVTSIVTGHGIPDLTSGLRTVRAENFGIYVGLLPNGFACPATVTMAFIRSGFPVNLIDIEAPHGNGMSQIKPLRHGICFLAIISKIATAYTPLNIPITRRGMFIILGLGDCEITFVTERQLTNKALILLSGAIIILLVEVPSQRTASLAYKE